MWSTASPSALQPQLFLLTQPRRFRWWTIMLWSCRGEADRQTHVDSPECCPKRPARIYHGLSLHHLVLPLAPAQSVEHGFRSPQKGLQQARNPINLPRYLSLSPSARTRPETPLPSPIQSTTIVLPSEHALALRLTGQRRLSRRGILR